MSSLCRCILYTIKTVTTAAGGIHIEREISILPLREPVTQRFHVIIRSNRVVHVAELPQTTHLGQSVYMAVSSSRPSCLYKSIFL